MGTANLPLARKLGGIPPASEFYREICLFLLTCKSKCKFVRVNATAKFKNFDSLLQIWGNSLFNGVECVKINSIRQEIGKKAKNSQRSDCRLLFCKGKSHPWKFSVRHLKRRVICGLLLQQLRRQNNVIWLDFVDIEFAVLEEHSQKNFSALVSDNGVISTSDWNLLLQTSKSIKFHFISC